MEYLQRGAIIAGIPTLFISWTILLFIGTPASCMSTETPPHRCYSCGPLAARWYEGRAPPNCSEFDRSERFMFDCLPGYGTCATSLDYDMLVLSRACVKDTPNGCKSEGDAKPQTQHTVCTCNGDLCNGNLVKPLSARTLTSSTTTTIPIDTTTIHKIKETTTPNGEKDSIATTIKLGEQSNKVEEQQDNEKTIALHENNESFTTSTPIISSTTVEITTEKNTVEKEAHVLPEPAALGQNNEIKKPQKQGAPVDDEEDNAEGSGSRIDVDHKNQTPTTTPKSSTAHKQSTESKNSATFKTASLLGCTMMAIIVKIIN